jgi:hypothetical protein
MLSKSPFCKNAVTCYIFFSGRTIIIFTNKAELQIVTANTCCPFVEVIQIIARIDPKKEVIQIIARIDPKRLTFT